MQSYQVLFTFCRQISISLHLQLSTFIIFFALFFFLLGQLRITVSLYALSNQHILHTFRTVRVKIFGALDEGQDP